MSLAQITLTTNKTVSNVDDYVRKIGQDERGQVLPVIVVDATGTPYDLSDKKIVFSESKDSGKYVVDDGKDSRSGKFTLTDAKNGKFSYTLQEQVYPESGTAWFDIVSADDTVLDTTVSFRFVVIPAPALHVNDDSYSSTLGALQAHYQGVIKNTETQTQNLINSLTENINQAISNGQKSIADELTDAKKKLQDLLSQERSLIQNWTAKIAEIESNADTQKNAIQQAADDQLKANKNANDAEIADVKKQLADELTDAEKKLQDLSNQESSLIQNWTAKIAEIESNADTQKNAIQQAADDQLKANKNANDAEIADIKKQLADELNKIEADKTAAIQGVTDARDKAISDATDKLNANLRSLQEDYNTWKTSAVEDLQAKLDKLTQQLNTDETDQASLKQAIDSAKEAVSKLHDIDFTVYAHKSDLDNYCTKAEANQKLGQKITFVKCDSPQAAHDASMNPAADGSIVFGIYDMNDEPSQAVVGDQKINIEWLYNHLNDLSTQVSGLSSLQSLINGKADSATVYTKSDTDGIVNTLKGLIAGKANSADVYTKSDTDNIVNMLKELIANAGKVKTVNNVQPDSNGNISISIPDISGKADKTDVNNLQNKVTSQEVEIADLKKSGTKLVGVTQAQYDQLVKDGKVQQNVIYAVSNS